MIADCRQRQKNWDNVISSVAFRKKSTIYKSKQFCKHNMAASTWQTEHRLVPCLLNKTFMIILKRNLTFGIFGSAFWHCRIMQNIDLIELPLNVVQLCSYLAWIFFMSIGTILGSEMLTFWNLKNKDQPITHSI